jgi:hypothetical protein
VYPLLNLPVKFQLSSPFKTDKIPRPNFVKFSAGNFSTSMTYIIITLYETLSLRLEGVESCIQQITSSTSCQLSSHDDHIYKRQVPTPGNGLLIHFLSSSRKQKYSTGIPVATLFALTEPRQSMPAGGAPVGPGTLFSTLHLALK